MSFPREYGVKSNLLVLDVNPKGFVDPVLCNRSIWVKIINETIKGIIKWKQKNRFTVTTPTLVEPQIIFTILGPNTGISLNRLIITEAPQ